MSAAVIERYELRELLGRGGMGAVYLAVDRKLEREVAIKVLPPEFSHDENVVERFEREARTSAKLDHANIIPIYSVEAHAEFHYFVMKYVPGRSLEQIIESGPMPVELVQRILWESACALGHAHQRGIVHRDIKPANIMIDETGRSVLTDFGISKAVEGAAQSLTATGQVVGTPHYMSPEQGKGTEVDGRSDQYSLAVVAYRMLSGQLPFEEHSVHAVLYKKIFEEAPPITQLRPDLPVHFVDALHRALAREPSERFGTMEEFATAIWPENPVDAPIQSLRASRSSIEGETEIATPVTPHPATQPQPQVKRRRRGLVLTSVLVVAGSGALGGWWWVNNQSLMGGERTAVDPVTLSSTQAGASTSTGDSLRDSTQTAAIIDSTPAPPSVASTPVTPPDTAAARPDPPRQPSRSTQAQRPTQTPASSVRAPPVRPRVEDTVGFLTINANPFGTVYVDGVEVQDTPLVNYRLSPGRHVIEVRRVGYVTAVDTIMVTGSNTLRLTKTLVRQP